MFYIDDRPRTFSYSVAPVKCKLMFDQAAHCKQQQVLAHPADLSAFRKLLETFWHAVLFVSDWLNKPLSLDDKTRRNLAMEKCAPSQKWPSELNLFLHCFTCYCISACSWVYTLCKCAHLQMIADIMAGLIIYGCMVSVFSFQLLQWTMLLNMDGFRRNMVRLLYLTDNDSYCISACCITNFKCLN